jgi:hypothetical protein
MPTVHDSLKDGRGIKILDTQLDSVSNQVGRYDLLYHTNGNVYIVFARTCQTYAVGAEIDRQIWAAVSTDGGTTFSAPVQLTARTGYWHDKPCICQIEPDDPDSPMGIIYQSSSDWNNTVSAGVNDPFPYRFLMDTDLTVISPIDIVTNYLSGTREGSLLRAGNSFLYFTLSTTADALYIWENQIVEANSADGFLDNAWTRRYVSNFAGAYDVLSYQARLLANGDIMILFAGRTSVVGDINLTNLYYSVSSDDGYTWTTPTALTNYTGTPEIDVVGMLNVLAVDLAVLSDGSVALVYQEGIPPQSIGYYSSPQYNIGQSGRAPIVLEGLNYIILPVSSGTYSGINVFDIASQTIIFRITTSTTPPIWSQTVYRATVSPDEKYLAVGTDTSLDIFHIEDADPANWTVTSLRTTTTPALKNGTIYWLAFSDNTTLLFAYGASSGTAQVWGGKVDVANVAGGITALYSAGRDVRSTSSSNMQAYVDVANDAIHVTSGLAFWVTKISDGSAPRGLSITQSLDECFYDDINDEWVLIGSSGIYRYTDNGTTLAFVSSITTTSTPDMIPSAPYVGILYPGSGVMLHLNVVPSWYDFTARKCIGPLKNVNEWHLGFTHYANTPTPPRFARNGTWVTHGGSDYVRFFPITNVGRFRWGIFHYNTVTKALDTSGSDFYDLIDSAWVPSADMSQLILPKICPAPSDNVVLAAFRYFPGRTGGRPLAFVTGVMNLEHQTFTMRAAIAKREPAETMTVHGRLAKTMNVSLTMLAQIHMAQCLKMRAWVIPEQTQTCTMRASIRALQYQTWQMQFSVSRTLKTRYYRLRFTVNTGYTGKWEMTMRARILTYQTYKFTGHFIVTARPADTGTHTFTVNSSGRRMLQMKAYVGDPQ